ncbi:hypothetical protein ACJX0J_020028 [Zea mays]
MRFRYISIYLFWTLISYWVYGMSVADHLDYASIRWYSLHFKIFLQNFTLALPSFDYNTHLLAALDITKTAPLLYDPLTTANIKLMFLSKLIICQHRKIGKLGH